MLRTKEIAIEGWGARAEERRIWRYASESPISARSQFGGFNHFSEKTITNIRTFYSVLVATVPERPISVDWLQCPSRRLEQALLKLLTLFRLSNVYHNVVYAAELSTVSTTAIMLSASPIELEALLLVPSRSPK